MREKKNYLFNNLRDENLTQGYLLNRLQEAERILAAYPKNTHFSDFRYDDITDLLYCGELLQESCRKILAEYDFGNNLIFIKEDEATVESEAVTIAVESEYDAFHNFPVEVKFNGSMLFIYTPLTFKRGYRKDNFMSNYLLSHYLEAAIHKWQKDNDINLSGRIRSPATMVMKRKAERFSIAKFCDADNLENQRIINSMTRALGVSDNAYNLSLYSTFELLQKEEKAGTYFYIFSNKDKQRYSYLLGL